MGHSSSLQLAFLVLALLFCAHQVIAAAPKSPSSSIKDGGLLGTTDAASERMLTWLRNNGAEVNVAIRTVPGMGRGVYAPRPFVKGDVLARIPVEMLWANHDREKPEELAGLDLLKEMLKQGSPWRPYFDALPGPSGVRCSLTIPTSYYPVIQHGWTEWSLLEAHNRTQQLWAQYEKQHPDVNTQGLSDSNLTYAMSLLRTRVFGFPSANILIPVVDMANHHNECRHSHVVESCDPAEGFKQWRDQKYPTISESTGSGVFDSSSSSSSSGMSGQCMVWRAEEPVAVGQDVCNSYGAGLQDRMLLQYGFLQSGPPTRMMSMMDKHTKDREQWHMLFRGNLSGTWAEIDRLAALLAWLKNGTEAAAAVQADESADPKGEYLSMLKEWRRQRIGAIDAELARLYREVQLMTEGFERWMSGAIDKGANVIAVVKSETCECAAAREDAGTSGGIVRRVLQAVNPWYDEM